MMCNIYRLIMPPKDAQKLLQQFKELQLNYKTRIIQLQKQGEYWKKRAEEYERKFKEVMLSSQDCNNEQILTILSQKQNQINDLRMHLLNLERSYCRNTINEYEKQNQQLKASLEELKEGAINAIMDKDAQIEALQAKLNDKDMERHIHQLNQRYDNLLKVHQQTIINNEAELERLHQKIAESRQDFMDKLMSLEKEVSNEQNIKQILIEKTTSLEGNLVSSEKVIMNYQDRIIQLENLILHQRVKNAQNESKMKMEYQSLQQLQKSLQKQCGILENMLKDYKYKEERYTDQIQNLKQEKQQLSRKISTMRRKQISNFSSSMNLQPSDINGKSIFSNIYQSKIADDENQYQNYQNLKEVKQLDEHDFIQNFTVYQEVPTPQTFANTIQQPNISQEQNPQSNKQIIQSKIQIQEENKLQKQINLLNERNKQLQVNQANLFQRIQQLTKSIHDVTENLQKQRKITSQLRGQLKKTTKESELIVELQSNRQHMFKLQNQMLIEKLQNAQKLDYQRQKYQVQKSNWTIKLIQMTEKLAILEMPKKKKKGFFG